MHNSELSLHLNCALDNPYLFTHGVQKQILPVVHIFQEMMKGTLIKYSCIQMFALNLMEILKITVYNTKYTTTTVRTSFSLFLFLFLSFSKLDIQQKQRVLVILMAPSIFI